jgi:hypothetical protein
MKLMQSWVEHGFFTRSPVYRGKACPTRTSDSSTRRASSSRPPAPGQQPACGEWMPEELVPDPTQLAGSRRRRHRAVNREPWIAGHSPTSNPARPRAQEPIGRTGARLRQCTAARRPPGRAHGTGGLVRTQGVSHHSA